MSIYIYYIINLQNIKIKFNFNKIKNYNIKNLKIENFLLNWNINIYYTKKKVGTSFLKVAHIYIYH